jgi:uncharacterized protein YjbI with pentapeptide repeats
VVATVVPDLAGVLAALTAGRPQEAVLRAREALRSHPHDARLHAALGIALCCLQEIDAGLVALERAHYLAPGDARILYNYALVLEKAGRSGEARIRLYAAVKVDPAYERALHRLARLPALPSDTGCRPSLPDAQNPGPTAQREPRAAGSSASTATVPPPERGWRRREVILTGVIAACGLLMSVLTRSPSGSLAAPAHPGQSTHRSQPELRNLVSAHLAGSSYPGVDFQGVDLRHADLSRANLHGATFTGVDLRQARLGQATMIDAVARGANLESAYLLGANLRNADLRETNLTKAYVKAARLSRAQLDQAKLRRAILSYADLSWASLRGADLTAACLKGADLSHANLRGTRLSAADLRLARLRYVDLTGATYSPATRWPSGFKPDEQGAIKLPGAL